MRRIMLFALMFVLMCTYLSGFTYSTSTAADSGIGIRIDGNLRQFTPSAQIKNDRTMIPIRLVVEDKALQGQVYWDNNLQKVAIDCRGKYIEMFIGSSQVMVDGQAQSLDVAPYIFEGRTFIPVRFLAENLGAVVGWDNRLREVLINFNQKLRVFAYYYRSMAEYRENAGLFSDVAFRWFQTNSKGELSYEYQDGYLDGLNLARSNGSKTHASVVLMGQAPLHELLSNKANRSRLIANLLDEVNKNNYDGVNIDFELMGLADAGSFTNFLGELKTSLGNEKELSVAVFARTAKDKWATPYEYKKIGEIADSVVVMAYDYSYSNTAPGPVAPLWWVKDVVAYMIDNIPREKILLGMPTYGYDWASGLNTTTVTASKLQTLRQTYEVKESFDYNSMSPYFTYTDDNGKAHQIWLENEKSLNEKINVARENHLGGISFWRIGNGFDDLYQLLKESVVKQ